MIKYATVVLAATCLGISHLRAHAGPVLADLGIDVHGFVDARAGLRTHDDPYERDTSLAEARLQFDVERAGDVSTVQFRADFLYDDVPADDDLDLEEGTGPIDLREGNILVSPLDFMDVKLGRQILTWGTGDLLFINDLFPKDWRTFFSGRDEEYLKTPSDAVLFSFFPGLVNIDVAYTPRFDADRYIRGDRISYWNPVFAHTAGRDAVVDPNRPDEWFDDDEVSVRISRNVAGYEFGLYGYNGFWSNPEGMDPATTTAFFPRLSVYGASLRGTLGKGLFSVEAGYYDSRDDADGENPFVPNNEARALIGYERELMRDFSAGLQYYVEYMQDYDEYRSSLEDDGGIEEDLSAVASAKEEDRQVATVRLTKQALNQNLTFSFFAYYSPTDKDAYLRPAVKYKATDAWLVTAGGNVLLGEQDYTFFGQFEKNSNVYGGVRYSF